MANHITRNTHVNVSHETREVSDVDRDDMRVNYRLEKLEQLLIQQIQNARLKLASLLSCVRRTKSAYGDQNAKPETLAFLRLHIPNATFSSARFVPLFRYTRLVSLR